MNKLPNFLIVGAPKCGTTSLYHYLNQHPEIYMSSQKEPHFLTSSILDKNWNGPGGKEIRKYLVKTIEEYKKNFSLVSSEKVLGEASPDTLFLNQVSIPKIKEYLGDPKIVIILRNPIDRAFSEYLHLRREGKEKLSFEDALAAEEKRKEDGWHYRWRYVERGFYSQQVKAFQDNFTDVKVFLFDDLVKSRDELIKDLFAFLGVDESFSPEVKGAFNVSGNFKFNKIQALMENSFLKRTARKICSVFMSKDKMILLHNKLSQMNFKSKAVMDPTTRSELISIYEKEIRELQVILDRDLTKWLVNI